jgi:hypothetical protein
MSVYEVEILLRKIENGDFEGVESLLRHGVNANCRNVVVFFFFVLKFIELFVICGGWVKRIDGSMPGEGQFDSALVTW